MQERGEPSGQQATGTAAKRPAGPACCRGAVLNACVTSFGLLCICAEPSNIPATEGAYCFVWRSERVAHKPPCVHEATRCPILRVRLADFHVLRLALPCSVVLGGMGLAPLHLTVSEQYRSCPPPQGMALRLAPASPGLWSCQSPPRMEARICSRFNPTRQMQYIYPAARSRCLEYQFAHSASAWR